MNNKSHKIMIGIVAVISITIVSIVVYYLCNTSKSKSVGTNWGEKYYEFLQKMSNGKNQKIIFAETSFYKDPLLIIYENVDDNDMVKFTIGFYALENGKVKNLSNNSYGSSEEIKFMYDIQKKQYNYFVCYSSEDSREFISFDSIIIDTKVNNIVVDMVTKEGLSTEERNAREKEELAKYDNYSNYRLSGENVASRESSYVIATGMKINSFDYKKDSDYLFNKVKDLVKSYKKNANLGKSYNKQIKKQLENNEESNITPQEASKELKVGDYTLKYGKYKVCFNGASCSEFTLNQDGTAMLDGKQKYFRIDKHNFAQGVEEYQSGENIYPAIIISDTKDGTEMNTYTPYATGSECLMTDGDLGCVNYIGE